MSEAAVTGACVRACLCLGVRVCACVLVCVCLCGVCVCVCVYAAEVTVTDTATLNRVSSFNYSGKIYLRKTVFEGTAVAAEDAAIKKRMQTICEIQSQNKCSRISGRPCGEQ